MPQQIPSLHVRNIALNEYRKSSDIDAAWGRKQSNEAILNVVLTAFGMFIVADAIQQTHINHFYGSDTL